MPHQPLLVTCLILLIIAVCAAGELLELHVVLKTAGAISDSLLPWSNMLGKEKREERKPYSIVFTTIFLCLVYLFVFNFQNDLDSNMLICTFYD